MNDKSQNPKIAGTIVALLTVLLGFGLVHSNLQSSRPSSAKASYHAPASLDKVESRLWQDPFEAFESVTNLAGWVQNSNSVSRLWKEINERSRNGSVAILGVMLPGGSYAEDKEVRLRLRYAVVMALLTGGLLAEDRTHISTNSVELTLEGGDQRFSRFAYEWFEAPASPDPICVLWLNEDNFADEPARRLGVLFTNIPSLESGSNVWFYLIGPRASDTLLALDETDTDPSDSLTRFANAAKHKHFHILSPEATVSVRNGGSGDPDVRNDLNQKFDGDIFRNWIAPDQQVANLISQELANRMTKLSRDPNNVVVLLSEQDTYYGSRLADEWIDALSNNGVCKDSEHVWQFGYLKGLDGSKPQAETQDQSPALPTTAEAVLETAMKQQQTGQRSDGDAQLDYVSRLGTFLKEKDNELKSKRQGRIIAFGFTGGDVYDKLILLQELRPKFPEAVFFTSDLDASLWTSGSLKYTRNLLVGSAYPLDPGITNTSFQPFWDEFEPFRDVYQTAVFRACAAVINEDPNNAYSLDCNTNDLRGGLYKIGRDGPVALALADPDPGPDPEFMRWLSLFVLLVTAGALVLCFVAGCKGGFRWAGPVQPSRPSSTIITKAEDREDSRQMSLAKLRKIAKWVAFGVFAVAGFQFVTWWIAAKPNEEPWDFSDGVSIWPSEYIRFLVLVLAIVFFFVARQRRQHHRKKLWINYFCENRVEDENSDKSWQDYLTDCKARWSTNLDPQKQHDILELDAYQLWEKGGRPDGKDKDDWHQAEVELEQERNTYITFTWTPPFIEMTTADGLPKAYVNAAALFRGYLHLGNWKQRLKRISVCVVIYFLMASALFWYLQDDPTNLLIRGTLSQSIDFLLALVATLLTLFVLFYVFDATLLTRQFLDYISRYSTCWPRPPLVKCGCENGVKPEHLDGLVDVDFAAVQTAEIGPLIFWPVILGLLLAISRGGCFDDWTWPFALILIYVLNFSAAAVCWYVVRSAAARVRNDAVTHLNKIISSVENSDENSVYDIPAPGNSGRQLKKAVYLENLKKVLGKIQTEDRGAFAKPFQDPTYFAVFIPSGISGVISVIASLWLGR